MHDRIWCTALTHQIRAYRDTHLFPDTNVQWVFPLPAVSPICCRLYLSHLHNIFSCFIKSSIINTQYVADILFLIPLPIQPFVLVIKTNELDFFDKVFNNQYKIQNIFLSCQDNMVSCYIKISIISTKSVANIFLSRQENILSFLSKFTVINAQSVSDIFHSHQENILWCSINFV